MVFEGVSGGCLRFTLAVGVETSASIGMFLVDKILVTFNGVDGLFGKSCPDRALTGLELN